MSRFRQITSVRDNYTVDTENEDFDENTFFTEAQRIKLKRLMQENDYEPQRTFETYEEFEKDLIEKIEIGLEQIENGEYYTFEQFNEDIKKGFGLYD